MRKESRKHLLLLILLYLIFIGVLSLLTSSRAHAVGQDKKFHFAAGCATSMVTNEVLRSNTNLTSLERGQLAILSGVLVGAAKESWDRGRKGHTSDIADFNATAAGSVACVALSFSF